MQQCNQETESAAMLGIGFGEKKAMKPTSIKLITKYSNRTTLAASTESHTKTDKGTEEDSNGFAMPTTPKLTAATDGCRSNSLKKQQRRNKTMKRNSSETEEVPVVNTGAETATKSNDNRTSQLQLKMSHSMTSLPADEEQQECRDVMKAKLNLERPYNSLKKNIRIGGANCSVNARSSGTNKLHRYSWGSGQSQCSSTSLHSSATTGLGCSGKDDLWAAIQTNYNYIMDTNLLDTCKEARCEIEGASVVLETSTENGFRILDETQRNEGMFEDPKELRRWIREMETKVERLPTISELTLLSISELQRHLAEHSVLYDEIVSHARVVSTCIRAASEREQHQQQQQQQQQQQPNSLKSNCSSLSAEQNISSLSSTDETITATTTATIATKSSNNTSGLGGSSSSSSNSFPSEPQQGEAHSPANATTTTATTTAHNNKKTEGNFERLRTRYYLLYLKAFEVQLCLDNLLSKRSSITSGFDDDTDGEEEEIDSYECDVDGAATEEDLNGVKTDSDIESSDIATQNSSTSFADLQNCSLNASELPARDVVNQQQIPVDGIASKVVDCEDGDDEEEEEDDVDNGVDVVDFAISKCAWRKSCGSNLLVGNTFQRAATSLTDFEADSESSDLEFVQKLRRQRKALHDYRYSLRQPQHHQIVTVAHDDSPPLAGNENTLNIIDRESIAPDITNYVATDALAMNLPLIEPVTTNQLKMGLNVVTQQQQQQQQQQREQLQQNNTNASNLKSISISKTTQNKMQHLPTRNNDKMLQQHSPAKQKNIAVIPPNTHTQHNNKTAPIVLRKRQPQQQHRHNDISKFNRSNRKSKNCAIFYFKHLDTDNEANYGGDDGTGTGGDVDAEGKAIDNCAHRCTGDTGVGAQSSSAASSSHGDILKSADASSDDDDGWLYTAASTANTSNYDCLNSTIVVVDGLQSSAVTSTTSTLATEPGTLSSIRSSIAVVSSDDSDKENKEALAYSIATTSTIVDNSPDITTINNSTCDSSSFSTTSSTSPSCINAKTTEIVQIQCGDNMDLKTNNNNNNNSTAKNIISNDCHDKSTLNASNSNSNNNNNNQINDSMIASHSENANANIKMKQQQQQNGDRRDNGNTIELESRYYARNDVSVVPPGELCQQHTMISSPGKRLPPRSPAKSIRSTASSSNATMSPAKGKVSHESIKQLVLEAEHLVREAQEAALKTPTKQKHSIVKISSTVKKREISMPGPIKQRVQEWLAHQPTTSQQTSKSHELHNIANDRTADDCEASGEASENDSIPQPAGSDTSEGFTDSIATCMQTSTNSYGNSTERIGGSAEPITSGCTSTNVNTPLGGGYGSSNQSLNVVKIVKRQQTRRQSERPWSVSCLSQLTTEAANTLNPVIKASSNATANNQVANLATYSISESALDSLSPGRPRASSTTATSSRKYDSKGSLRRRRTRKKRLSVASAGKKSDSGSEAQAVELPKLTQSLMKTCEGMSSQQIQEITNALLSIQQQSNTVGSVELSSSCVGAEQPTQLTTPQKQLESGGEDQPQLMKPNFRVGSYTTTYMTSEARLGSLAALATYMHDDEQQGEYSTEDHHSSFSETAWDNYQEKYNSENYSEGFDSDAARRLLEFGDDYRNFIDSQSDCCSSLSAANNLDSFSPPRMDSLQKHELKVLAINQETIVSSVDHARRRRALELEYERRRKTLEVRRKSCQEATIAAAGAVVCTVDLPSSSTLPTTNNAQSNHCPVLSSSSTALTPKNSEKAGHLQNLNRSVDTASRKLDFSGNISHSTQSLLLRRTSESDTSGRRQRRTANIDERRRSSRNLEKCIKMLPATTSTSATSGDDSDEEKEMRNLLQQSRNRHEDTRSLKIRCHLLRPEDYNEIINTCRDNIRCLEAVLRGPPGTVLSARCAAQTKDLLAAWEDLLGWSENAAAARSMQEEMIVLKHSLNRLGNKSTVEQLDTEPAIQIAIEVLKNEKTQLQTYRTSMLRLNASVHSWLTRQERRLQVALIEQHLKEAAIAVEASAAEASASADNLPEAENQAMKSEQNINISTTDQQEQQQVLQPITTITVTDSNGNQVETLNTEARIATVTETVSTSTTMASSSINTETMWDVKTLMHAEEEFHKHLKDEVSGMYSAWDEADARINSQLEVLTNSLIAWRQLECGLSEFQLALGQDRGTLKGLEGALNKGQATPVELAQNVKLVAKLLSEKVNVSQEQLIAVQERLDPNHVYHIAKFTASNGSLSDSGISDGGATSDGGLSERERRLGVLRRLAKQLESALAPGSEAMKSIAARMESAEAELKTLQNTCRDLIVRTAATHQNKKQQAQNAQDDAAAASAGIREPFVASLKPHSNGCLKGNGHAKKLSAGGLSQQRESATHGKRKNKSKQRKPHNTANGGGTGDGNNQKKSVQGDEHMLVAAGGDGGDDPQPDYPSLEFDLDSSDTDADTDTDGKARRRGWAWRIAKVAVPMQLALFTVFCAACLMQPNCCDNLNNLSMSFTPQLRYIRGPPPI